MKLLRWSRKKESAELTSSVVKKRRHQAATIAEGSGPSQAVCVTLFFPSAARCRNFFLLRNGIAADLRTTRRIECSGCMFNFGISFGVCPPSVLEFIFRYPSSSTSVTLNLFDPPEIAVSFYILRLSRDTQTGNLYNEWSFCFSQLMR